MSAQVKGQPVPAGPAYEERITLAKERLAGLDKERQVLGERAAAAGRLAERCRAYLGMEQQS